MVFSKYSTLEFWSTLWWYYCNIIFWHSDILIIDVTYVSILYGSLLCYTLLYHINGYPVTFNYNILHCYTAYITVLHCFTHNYTYCIILYYIILYYAWPCYTVVYDMILYSTIRYCTIYCFTILDCIIH